MIREEKKNPFLFYNSKNKFLTTNSQSKSLGCMYTLFLKLRVFTCSINISFHVTATVNA